MIKNSLYILSLILLITIISCTTDDLSFNLPKVIKLPILTTLSISDIKSSSATSGGEISFDGGGIITARGICFATTTLPTTSSKIVEAGSGDGNFSASMIELLPNTTYYVRAYATNSVGTSYGNELIFKTLSTIATVITTTPTNITSSSVTSGGNVIIDGGSAVSTRGICFAASTTNPTILNSVINSGSGSGLFSANIIGLLPNTTYYVRAFATNSVGTAYGAIYNFRTSTTIATLSSTNAYSITTTSAVSGGNISSDGGSSISSRGVCYATTINPTTINNQVLSGFGNGSFNTNLSGLLPNTTYYARAFAINSSGTAYGPQISFITGASIASLTTTTASSITTSSATSGGNITTDGGYAVTSRGVCFATNSNPTIFNSTVNAGSGAGSFTSNITGLSLNTTYYVRAYATNALGTAYGSQISFVTSGTVSSLTTTSASNITVSSATSGGNITNEGGYAVTSRGLCYATSSNPTTSNNIVSAGSGLGSFSANITGLAQNMTYYVRAYATNAAGTAYGSQISFKTDVGGPAAQTLTVNTSAVNASITAGSSYWYKFQTSTTGTYSIETYGSTDTYMTLYQSDQITIIESNDDGGSGSNSRIIRSLSAGTWYYVKIRGFSFLTTGNYSINVKNF